MNLLIIDTETTGLSPFKNGLIQLAAVSINDKFEIVDTFCEDVCPTEPYEVTQQSLEITNFTLGRIRQGLSYSELCQKFHKFLFKNYGNQQVVPVGQFYAFDHAFLQMVFSKAGEWGEKCDTYFTNHFIDTKVIGEFLNLQAESRGREVPFPVLSLSKEGGYKDRFGLDRSKYQAHDALDDVRATLDVLKEFVRRTKVEIDLPV
jgi:DNA polymerase III epsilon subunit-like protein